jgi:transcriptional regulator with XRE-family HTH domain
MSKQKPRRSTEHDINIGFRIRKIRQDKRLTQSEVAAELHITYQQLQKYELGKNKIPASRLSKVARILGVSEQDILNPSEKNFEQSKRLQDQRIALLWGKLEDDKKRNIVLMLLESLTGTSN